MRIWIDLANSPHVPFFRPLANEFTRRGHEVIVTARQFAETVPLAEAAGFAAQVIGGHGGAKLAGKAGNLVGEVWILARWARGKEIRSGGQPQLLLPDSCRARTVAAMCDPDGLRTSAGKPSRLSSRFERHRSARVSRSGVDAIWRAPAKVKRYDGIKEDVYLGNFVTDQNFADRN